MDIHELYDDIFLSHRPAIIIHIHFCTDGDFGVRLDEDGRGIYSGLAYDTDEIENIDLKEDLVIWNPEDDKVKIYIEALHTLKNVSNPISVVIGIMAANFSASGKEFSPNNFGFPVLRIALSS